MRNPSDKTRNAAAAVGPAGPEVAAAGASGGGAWGGLHSHSSSCILSQ